MLTSMEPVLHWAANAVGGGTRVLGVEGLRDGADPWLLRIESRGEVIKVVLRIGGPGRNDGLATEAAALVFAEEHQLAAPRLIAVDLDGAAAGVPAVLMTFLDGSSTIPPVPSTERLRAMGAAAGALHAIRSLPSAHLPLRTRPIPHDNYAAERRRAVQYRAASPTGKAKMLADLCALTGWHPTHARQALQAATGGASSLMAAAEERLYEAAVPQGETVFVHGDLWQGNMLWTCERCVGIVDWDSAGVGHPGVDLSSLRLDAAIMFGVPAAATVLDGWRWATGREPSGSVYWDIVAALNTPADMHGFLPVLHGQGRVDLDALTVRERRDAFLRAALDQLDRA